MKKIEFLYRGFKAQYRDQRAEIKSLVSGLAQDDIAVDVGANKGAYLRALSRAVPRGRVVAFEPQPALANYLRQICKEVGFDNVLVECAGVSSKAGETTLYIPGGGETSPGASLEAAIEARQACRHIQVPVLTLDDYFSSQSRHIGALKIDVEGHESAVLEGATRLIRQHAPTIVVECENRHLSSGTVYDVIEFLRSLDYDGCFVQRHALMPLSEFKLEVHQRTAGERYWDAPDYCNNFVLNKNS